MIARMFKFIGRARPKSLVQVIVVVLLLKLMFVLLMKLNFLGEKQTKGVVMQLPVERVEKHLLEIKK